jgi:hypothetical protein
MCSKTKAQPSGMFQSGQDLPLFSGTPITVRDRGYAAKPNATQPALPGMPPIERPRRKCEELTIKDLPMFEDMPEDL